MLANLGGWHLLVILAVVLLLFGATRLPALSKGLGQSIRIFRTEVHDLSESDAPAKQPEGAAGSDGITTRS
ncbi:twin-arginine translocase TatA/TatE family subunit [Leifsonia shinshuensis]|uniref:Sec-independent protein translocase protein TatA n=1 Tax=Leifsonia shinshuensis TaxID=150026 RepID=A0A7G6YBD6_9MICO|nr:twin-arginine translocase TatA/TatE family subunit [Leifsonia shinshuensis]QNE35801.1 twin-arginine translocase TatA/TatE family subunit [Leifsonia shinshuensis]